MMSGIGKYFVTDNFEYFTKINKYVREFKYILRACQKYFKIGMNHKWKINLIPFVDDVFITTTNY